MAPRLTPPHNKFPGCATCPLLSSGDSTTCVRCVASSSPLSANRCSICSRDIGPGGACGNPVCGWPDRHLVMVHAICRRTGAIENILKRFKYEGEAGWAPILGRVVVGWLWDHWLTSADPDYDLIVVNPTHPDRTPLRHTELILASAQREDQLGSWRFEPAGDTTLVKHAETESATSLGTTWKAKKQAADQLWSAISVAHPERVIDKRILVVDDVTTTLLQLNVIAGLLERAGAASVEGLVLARQGG